MLFSRRMAGSSMRIYDRDLTGTAATDTGRAQDTQRTERDGSGAAAAVTQAASGGDHVELSSGLATVARALAAYGTSRTTKVQQLATQVQSGTYQPNSMAISQGMVAQALGAQ